MSPRGRRPAGTDARGDILVAARRVFAERGYDSSSMRGIARAAEVDPALVHHYFDGKSDLFFHAIIGDIEGESEERVRPDSIMRAVVDGPPDEIAVRWTRAFLDLWDRPGASDRFSSLVGAVTAGDEVRDLVLEFLQREIFGPITASIAPDRASLRAQLAASHILGLAVTRYVGRLPVLVETPKDDLIALTAPNLQRYLTGDLPEVDDTRNDPTPASSDVAEEPRPRSR